MTNRALFYVASIFGVVVLTVVITLSAQPAPVVQSREPALVVVPSPINGVTAESYVVFDVETGQTIATHNENEQRPIASVTKLFSAATILEQAPLGATTTIEWTDVSAEGRAGKLEAYTEYSYRDLLWPLLLESSNDAAAALERVDPELIAEMNELVISQAANNTHFADASGLSPENISTAQDLALLTRNLFFSLPHLFDMTQLTQYIGKQTGWVNNNPFIKESDYRGGKHGFTYEAARTSVALFEETLRTGDTRLLGYVVLGSEDLASDMSALRDQIKEQVSLQ